MVGAQCEEELSISGSLSASSHDSLCDTFLLPNSSRITRELYTDWFLDLISDLQNLGWVGLGIFKITLRECCAKPGWRTTASKLESQKVIAQFREQESVSFLSLDFPS